MKTFARSVVVVLALASVSSSAFANGYGDSGYSCKRYCASWGWCGWGTNKHKCCKAWSC